jgi:addiction module RelB/DinJ family antitoxin
MQAQDVRVTIRVDKELKESAENLFDYLGLNMSNAINIFLRKTVEQRGIPFPVNIGSNGFGGLNTNEVTQVFNNAVEQDIEGKKRKGLPIARYDLELKKAYLENADGTREYV